MAEEAREVRAHHREARRATADALSTSLEQMKMVEELRRTLRQIKDINKLESN